MLASWYPANNRDEEAWMAFTENLHRLRLARFLSQGDLSRQAGMHSITLTRLEAGSSAPSTRSVRALADVLGVEPGELAAPDEVAELRRVLKPAPTDGAETPSDRPQPDPDSRGDGSSHE